MSWAQPPLSPTGKSTERPVAQHSSRPELLEAEPGGLLTSRGTEQRPALLLYLFFPSLCLCTMLLNAGSTKGSPSSREPGLQSPSHL